MRKLDKETAIRLTLKMWRWLARTGRRKQEYYNMIDRRVHEPHRLCFLCEYTQQQQQPGEFECYACPYYQKYGQCVVVGVATPAIPYSMWAQADTPHTRKGWASECVKQLRTLL